MLCVCSPVAEIDTDQSNYTVYEDDGQLEVWISIINGQKAPGQECQIIVATANDTGMGIGWRYCNAFVS